MGKTLQDITMYSKAIIDSKPWILDPRMLPIPWRPAELNKKLKIAVLWNDGLCHPTPPVRRALKTVTEKLKAAGHEIVDWDPKLHPKAVQCLGRMFVADGGKSVGALLAPTKEPFRPEMQMYADAEEMGVHDMWQLQAERSELQRLYLEQWRSVQGLDAILGMYMTHERVDARLTSASTNHTILERTAWPFQVRRVHGCLQCGRLLRCVLPDWSLCR